MNIITRLKDKFNLFFSIKLFWMWNMVNQFDLEQQHHRDLQFHRNSANCIKLFYSTCDEFKECSRAG